MTFDLSKRTILLLAQAWSGTLRGLKNFADLNGIDWEEVVYERDPTSASVEAHAQAMVNVALKKDEWFKAFLDELGYREVFDLLGEINKDLERDKLTLMDLDGEWVIMDISKTKTSTVNVDEHSKKNEEQTTTKQDESKSDQKKWDVFISHATEDKIAAAPLAKKLLKAGLNVWYDQYILRWGDSLMDSINSGLRDSIFGIVILSKTFFKKQWTQTELKGLLALANATGEKRILPLLYKISHEEITGQYPILADIVARSWDDGLDNLANEVKEMVNEKKSQN